MDISGKRVLVTGGSSGIGKATASALVSNGAKVAITGRDLSKLNGVALEIGATAVDFDVSKYDSIERGVKETIEALGGLDVLVNNAGIGVRASVDEMQPDMFEQVFSVNVIGAAMVAKAVIPHMRKQKSGHILNIGSTAALNGYPTGSVYVASKFALRGMTQCWMRELRQDNIRVMLINPSEVTTAFGNTERKERDEQPSKLRSEEIADAIVGALKIDDRGFIPEFSVWATNPQ